MSKESKALQHNGVVVRGPIRPGYERILNQDSLEFLGQLHRKFDKTRRERLQARVARQKELDAGKLPTFLPSTANVRNGDWKAASIPADLADRRVEITGPVDRKMIINALNSGAKVFMADFEDSSAPTWDNMVDGQINLSDANDRSISLKQGGKDYKLKEEKQLATLMVRPRGWHLDEAHVTVDGEVMSGSLFDFGLYFFHNAKKLLARGSGPYFYLPKMESHLEARLWNDVFNFAQDYIGIKRGTIRATCLIETILAAFEMDEIIYELRDHSAGLNCGRWDYIFSFIKKFRNHKDKVLPDRAQVTMTVPWMANYVRLLVQICHKRGVHAMGGMAAQIPVKDDEKANEAANNKVKADKLREAKAGHDGTWVAHPALIPIAMKIFNENMPTPNQIHITPDQSVISPESLLDLGPKGSITEEGIRSNLTVGLLYVESWLRGVGCVPIHNLMEDAATAEISRCQIWQWIKHGASTDKGKKIDRKYVQALFNEEVAKLKQGTGDKAWNERKYEQAIKLYQKLMFSDSLADFLTLEAYPSIVTIVNNGSPKSKL